MIPTATKNTVRERRGSAVSSDNTTLLISDRPDCSRELAHRLGAICRCQTMALFDRQPVAAVAAAVVADVGFRDPANIRRVRELLSWPRASGAPIIAILRDNSHQERVQATALGATVLLPATASDLDLAAALAPAVRYEQPCASAAATLSPAQNIEQASLQFGMLFSAAVRGEAPTNRHIEATTKCVMTAIGEGGIRRWLEIIWRHDDATYQHCLLVTGLAAEFARSLRFTAGDQMQLIRGALLHDIGKAKIPLAILNKPGALTANELTVIRTHAQIGYEFLRQQGGYESAVLEVVLRHHELLDGSGYPGGLSRAQITDLVRLVTICDIYAALIERRAYRAPMEPARAFKTLQDMDGKLETALVRAFASVAEKSAAPRLA